MKHPDTPMIRHVAVVQMIPVNDKKESSRKGRKFKNISSVVMKTLRVNLEKPSGDRALKESANSNIIDNPAPIKSSVKVISIKKPIFSPKQNMPMSWYVFNCGYLLSILPNRTAVCLVVSAAKVMHTIPSTHPDKCNASGIDKIPRPINTLIELKIVCKRVDFNDTTLIIESESLDLMIRISAIDSLSSIVP